MGEIFDELLKEIGKNKTLEQQVIELCEAIWKQEKEEINVNVIEGMPEGPNIMLVLPCPGMLKGEVAYLTLERDIQESFIAGLWVNKNGKLLRSQIWGIKEVNCQRVLKKYAEILKYLKGE